MLLLDGMNCVLWLDNWISGEERGKIHSSSGMLTRKWSCSMCSVLIQVCFRDLRLEGAPQWAPKGHIMSILNTRWYWDVQHRQIKDDFDYICAHSEFWGPGEMYLLGKRLIPPSYAGSFEKTLHQVLFKLHCRHIFCFIDPEIISVLSF